MRSSSAAKVNRVELIEYVFVMIMFGFFDDYEIEL